MSAGSHCVDQHAGYHLPEIRLKGAGAADLALGKSQPITSLKSACWKVPARARSPTAVNINNIHISNMLTVFNGGCRRRSPVVFFSLSELLKSSIQELRCPRALQEADFVDLLRSTFPQLAGGDKCLELFKSDRSRRLQRLPVSTLTPEEIYRSMKGTRADKTLLYVQLKVDTAVLSFPDTTLLYLSFVFIFFELNQPLFAKCFHMYPLPCSSTYLDSFGEISCRCLSLQYNIFFLSL